MYVIVRYGDRQQHIFNPNCRSSTLLRSIRDKCSCGDAAEDIELSDECGNIKYLRDAHNRYANEVLGERETLVLLRVDGTEQPYPRYTPLLKDEEAITEEFLARLVIKDEPTSRPQSLRKGKGRGPPSDKEKSTKDKANKDKSRQTKHSQERPARSRSRQAREQ
ncbi:uncharacterized protein CXorf65-like [Haliotis rubra]|uniref:uncharacterized protein CXorf65-like n=1 Tax=Haliotis rubra TaxID=36100 RepID=UPI001EE5021D|nr:uncharacterized protein CXorf65-like [Haliotis rubra]